MTEPEGTTRPRERIGAFFHTELGPNRGRVRAFLRTEAGLLLASFIIITFKPTNAYWTVVYVLLVSVPTVGNSVGNAVERFNASVVGCAAAVLIVIAAFDEPWLYTPLQALILGITLYIARSTPVGAPALTGGATFAIVSGSDVGQPPSILITLGFYRILQAVIGSGIGAFAQRIFWPDDPLALLRESLAAQLAAVEARQRGEPAPLDASRVGRHFELLSNAEMHHPGLVHCRSEVTALLLDVGRLVDETLRHERLWGVGAPPPSLLDDARQARRRLESAKLFEPPPPTPPAPPLPWRLTLAETTKPARRAVLKLALSVFIATVITKLLGYAAGGAMFTALAISMQVTSGTAFSKSWLVVAGVALGLAVVLLIVVPMMPNLEDPGSFLVMAVVAFAPTAWLTVGGPRVRNAGFFGTVIVATTLFADFRAGVDLEQPAVFALTLAIGTLVIGAVDRVVWPVDARRSMLQRAALIMRESAELYRERDPRVVLAPNQSSRWRIYRHLVALVQLRGERVPLPGTPWFEPEEEALRLAATTQRLVVDRISAARRELESGTSAPGADAERAAVAARLDARAAQLEGR
jgi:uncharacterized membrane protein YccC